MAIAIVLMLATLGLCGAAFLNPKMRNAALARIKGTEMKADENGFTAGLFAALSIAFIIIGSVVALLIVAKMSPAYIHATENVTHALQGADFGDDTANSLTPVFITLIAVGALVSLVVLALGVLAIRSNGGGA